MKNILFIVLLFISIVSFSQKVDTVFVMKQYSSYFDFTYKQPLYVKYTIKNGGGDYERPSKFISSKHTLTDADYKGSGFDRGHLVPAEDFAYDSILIEETFRYFNVVPQYANLNRGIWKIYENITRKHSTVSKVTVIAGGFDYELINNLYVPKYMYKIILRDNKFLEGYVFTNKKEDNTVIEIFSFSELYKLTKYEIQ